MISHPESERSILGAMLRSRTAVIAAVDQLQPSDFTNPANREIFSAMLTLALTPNQSVDLTTLDAELTRRGKLDAVGGAAYLVELSHTVPSAANVQSYIKIVTEKSNLRGLQAIAEAIIRKTRAEELKADEIIEMVEGACYDITTRARAREKGWVTLGDAVLRSREAMENRVKPIPTGFKELDDNMCGGLKKGELTIIGARTGRGKSAVMLTVGMNAAEAGSKIGYLSLEMSETQISQRSMAATSLVSITKQQYGIERMTDHDWEAFDNGMIRLTETGVDKNFRIYEDYGLTVERLENIVRHAVDRGELDLLIIDYIQLLRTTEKTTSDFERIGKVTKALKRLALSLNIPILTAAQVGRESEGRAPTLNELRGSGDLEQDADNVLLLHTPDSPDDPILKHISQDHLGIWERAQTAFAKPCSVQIAKQRQGPTCRTWCLFKPMIMRFYEDHAGSYQGREV